MRLLAAVLLAGPVLASSASAKEVVGATMCGGERCRTISGAAAGHDVMPDSRTAKAPEAAPFLRLTVHLRVEEGEEVAVDSVYVPSAGLLGGEGGWMRPVDGSLGTLERLARGLEPWPASELPGAAPAPEPAARTSPPAPPDRSSPTWLVVALGAVPALLGLAAFARGRHGGAGRRVALP